MGFFSWIRDFCGRKQYKRTLVITGRLEDRVHILQVVAAAMCHVHAMLRSRNVPWAGAYYTGIALGPYDGTLLETLFPPGIDEADDDDPMFQTICEKRSRTATSLSE